MLAIDQTQPFFSVYPMAGVRGVLRWLMAFFLAMSPSHFVRAALPQESWIAQRLQMGRWTYLSNCLLESRNENK